MKSILKVSSLAILLALASCAHHGKCHGDKGQCDMKKGEKECKCKDQCNMKKEEAKTEEVKK